MTIGCTPECETHLSPDNTRRRGAILFGGRAISQYPYLDVPDLTNENASASDAMPRVNPITHGFGAVIPIPSLVLRFAMFKGKNQAMTGEDGASTGELDADKHASARH